MSEATAFMPQTTSLKRFVDHERFRAAVLSLIVISAVLLGIETAPDLPPGVTDSISLVNQIIIGAFVVELILRITAYRLSFFREPWNLFDFAIVSAALIAPSGPFQVIRSLRILRALRLVSTVPSLRRVVDGLLGAIPGIASVLFLLLLVLYIAAVMATGLFRDVAPEYFGHLGISLFSLFQIMTLEGWSEIATLVMAEHEWAWIFFIGYILVATFLVLNLVIGVVVSSIQSRIESEQALDDTLLREELSALREDIQSLRQMIGRKL